MKNRVAFFLVCLIIFSLLIAVVFPSPLHNDFYDTLSEEEKMHHNDYYEQFEKPDDDKQKVVQIRNENWFNFTDLFFSKFEKPVRVIDCLTLQEYYVLRTGGYNHADVETVSPKDTEIFKSLYSNEWNWSRRSVWVEIAGVFFAASINGMPHSYDYVQNNNMEGHTCIHFLQSKTHGTKKVDVSHQNAVKYAFANKDKLIKHLKSKNNNL